MDLTSILGPHVSLVTVDVGFILGCAHISSVIGVAAALIVLGKTVGVLCSGQTLLKMLVRYDGQNE